MAAPEMKDPLIQGQTGAGLVKKDPILSNPYIFNYLTVL